MTAVHKISMDLYEDAFTLIALHSVLEDYAMVYALNLYLKSNFRRTSKDFELIENVSFPIFEWKETKNDRYWTLFKNSSIKEEISARIDLFENETSFTAIQVVPEFKEADYLLKIEHDDDLEEGFIRLLKSIPKVVTAYTIETENLKSKTNLIF